MYILKILLLLLRPVFKLGTNAAERPASGFILPSRLPCISRCIHTKLASDVAAPARAVALQHRRDQEESTSVGKVIRLGAREYHPEYSKPASREYTTRKTEQDSLVVTFAGAHLDYNHYRTFALDGTRDRAISILTTDTMKLIQSYGYPAVNGDLGENILVSGVTFSFFEPGKRYRFLSDDEDSPSDASVVLEITEAMIPCANLCKLPYICDNTKSPKEQVETCKQFLALLDKSTGQRGWYAKVIKEGEVKQNFQVLLLEATEASISAS